MHSFIDDPPRLLEEHIAPKLCAALAEETELHDLSCEIEVVLNGAGTWHFRLARGQASLEKGPSTKPSVILELAASDLGDFVIGGLRPERALIDGRLELAGDLGLAMRLAPLLRVIGS